jgi:ribonuclease Z
MTNAIYEAWKEDIDIRTNGLERNSPGGYRVATHEIAPGVVYDSAGVRITAIPVLHGSWPQSFGYRIDTPNRSIVISGDTRPAPALIAAARNVDVLIHEVHPESAASATPPNGDADWPRYLREFHTSDVELGKLAAEAKPKMLILYHVASRATVEQGVIAAIHAQGYRGRVVAAKDLDRF